MAKTQTAFGNQKLLQHRLSHGGTLRKSRLGRRERPLSTKSPIHLVFKANRHTIPGGFRTHRRFQLIHQLVQQYALRFFVKVEQITIQGDHWHLVVRTSRRTNFQSFLRVVAGQTAQRFLLEGLTLLKPVTDTPAARRLGEGWKLWMHRPFTRVVKGYRAYRTVRDYVQLNEMEALGKIPYRKQRLNGLRREERDRLWRDVTDTPFARGINAGGRAKDPTKLLFDGRAE